MGDKNSINCVVCGKKDRIMKRCGRCHLIFYCSVECQRIDWVTHKANCCMYSSKMEKSGDDHDDDTVRNKALDTNRLTSTGRKCNTVSHKYKQQELTQNAEPENAEQDLDKHFVGKCQLTSSQINFDPSKSFLSHDAQAIDSVKSAQTVKQRAEITEGITKLKESENSVVQSHVVSCSHTPTIPQDDISNVVVYVKYAKEKHKVELGLPCTGLQALEHFSRVLHIPLGRLKLIHKGKLQTESTILEKLKPNSVFLAFGEIAESEDGLEPDDIELIMKQLSVERNVAIRALRKTNCVVDAIFEIGNNL